ncbi:MAG: AAA family ATPase, partial [Gemmataceae bacterium]
MARKKAEVGRPADGQRAPSPAYFLSLSLENVRCFGPKQTLDLSDGEGGWARWTVLLGENGVGKTTVLQALALIEQTRRRAREETKQSRTWWDTSLPFMSLPRTEWVSAKVGAALAPNGAAGFPQPRIWWHTQLDRMPGGISAPTPPRLSEPETGFVIPLLCGYGAGRRLGSS